MARIVISGYYGFNNAGDDTVLYGIISSLKKHDPKLEIAVLSNTPAETKALFGYPAYDRWNLSDIRRGIRSSDLLVMGGGSLLQDATSPRSVIYYLGIVFLAKVYRKPVAFFAQGVGPIRHSLSKFLIKKIVNKVDVITVRDHQSGEDLKNLGVTKVPIHVTADPAVTIPPEAISPQRGKELLDKLNVNPQKPSVALSVRDWKREKRFKKELAALADDFIRKGWNVIFLPMHYPADVSASKEIIGQMKETGARIIERKIDFKDIMSFIGQMDLVIGMRLHSLILSSVMNVPFVAISYDPKIDRFVERLGLKAAGHISTLKYEELAAVMENVTADLDGMKRDLKIKMKSLVHTAEESSRLALDLLKKEPT